tara:strand:- start:839 stop:1057 length:219 start_codon:yes stop_codon:yes gene_type:complete
MKPEKRKIIWNFILNKGCQLITKLLTDARHSEEKNVYAHICSEIKRKFKCSYKDMNDENIIKLVNFIKKVEE